MYDLVGRLKKEEMVALGGDLNGYEGVHGGFGYDINMEMQWI